MKKFFVIMLVMAAALFMFAEETEWLIRDVEGGVKGGTLYLGTTSGPKTLNAYWSQESSSRDIYKYMYESLMGSDNKAQVNQPALAKRFWREETADGGTAYYFELRKGLKWSDGQPLTVEDIVFTYENIIKGDGMTADGVETYQDTEGNLPELTVDGNILKFKYPTKYRFGYDSLGGITIMPKHIFKDKVDSPESFAQMWTIEQIGDIISSGPYIVTEYREGVRVVLERNPYYFIKSKDGVQLPYLDKLVFLIVQDTNTMRLKFEAGDIDLLQISAADYPAIKAQQAEKNWNIIVGGPNASSQFIAFNFNAKDPIHREWFRNDNFRLAMSFAFDRETIIDTLYNGLGEPMYGPRNRTSAFYNPEIESFGFRYSIAKAKRYLQQAGFTWNSQGQLLDWDGNVVEFEITTNSGSNAREEIANIFVDSVQKLGINVNYRPVQFNTLVQNLYSANWDSLILGLQGGDDPAWGTNVWSLNGGLHFWNWSPEVQDWVDPNEYYISDAEKRIDEIMKINRSVMDPAKVQDLWDEWQMLAAGKQILVYTVSQNYLVAMKDDIVIFNPEPSPLYGAGVLWNIEAIYKK
ncbi:MAG: peptide/nickel transport system substrate-binding protein [Oceanotoga sp.]|uniref:ABC transporter substrate-binding protein n=1 Tax=Oceanotoga sp. TaxID=2108366 RepID=UPI002652B148|nr:ABC transporter substrate-binding protein [Oceanotoga sp.]MDN5341822.1 peptide/nickel transport system substrate-binding protein [Oceanotoga sp.]